MPILNRDQAVCIKVENPASLNHLLSKEERQPVNILLQHLSDKQFELYAGGSVIREAIFGPDIRHRVFRVPDIDIFAVGDCGLLQFIPLEKKVSAQEYWLTIPAGPQYDTLEFLAFNEREGHYAGVTEAALQSALPAKRGLFSFLSRKENPSPYRQPGKSASSSEPVVKSYHLLPKRYTLANGQEVAIPSNDLRRIDLSLMTPQRWHLSEYQH